jgi:hypothetical protein
MQKRRGRRVAAEDEELPKLVAGTSSSCDQARLSSSERYRRRFINSQEKPVRFVLCSVWCRRRMLVEATRVRSHCD